MHYSNNHIEQFNVATSNSMKNSHPCIVLLYTLLTFLLITQCAHAQEDTDKLINGFGIAFEQDVALIAIGLQRLNTDRNYTQGLDVYFTSGRLRKVFDPRFKLKPRVHYLNPNGEKRVPRYVYNLPTQVSIFNIAGFTPDDLRDSMPIIGDRPYSTVALWSLKDTRVDQENYRSRTWRMSIGVLGVPNAAKNAQTWIHRKMNDNNTKPPYDPQGWHNQISHGGEPTALLSYGVRNLINKKPLEREASSNSLNTSWKLRGQISSSWNINLLYLTDVSYGIDVRYGKIDLRNWYQEQAWQMDAISRTAEDTNTLKQDYFLRDQKFEMYGFAGMRSGIMLYNASLHGQFRNTAYRLPYWDTGFFTNVGRVGVTIASSCFSLSVYGAWKSSEVMTQYARIHSWAAGSLSFNW